MVSEVNENQGSKVQYFGPLSSPGRSRNPAYTLCEGTNIEGLTRLSDQLNVLGHPPL
jgi:hypothetical protein